MMDKVFSRVDMATITFDWFDCTCGFNCQCGADMILPEEGWPSICDVCGREYRLISYLEVCEPAPHPATPSDDAPEVKTDDDQDVDDVSHWMEIERPE